MYTYTCAFVCLGWWWSTSPVWLIVVWFVFVSVLQPMCFRALFEVLDLIIMCVIMYE